MNKLHFTKKTIEQLPTPERLTNYHDIHTRGLKLVVRPSGTKTFILYRKINQKPERITLGRFPDLSIEQARGLAHHINADIAQGKNPSQEKRRVRHEMTLSELFELYLEQHAKPHKKSWRSDQAQFERYLTQWKTRRLSHISLGDVQSLHIQLGKDHGIYTANRLLALLKTLFNKAMTWGWAFPNPTIGIKKFKEQTRDRFMQADELPRFFEALAKEPNEIARDYFLISLLTGARKSNVLEMRWEDIQWERQTWLIPETKSGEPHTLPLVPTAMELLQRRKAAKTDSPWVFPGTGKTGHFMEPKKAWARILASANIENLRIHDLRRSLGSWQAATGANLSIIGKTLAHKNTSTTAIYARLGLDPVRDAMEKATNAMFAAQ